jgi:hypothetical protein
VKIRSVSANNRKRAFEVRAGRAVYDFPYARSDPRPGAADRVADVHVDDELGREGFTYVLESGREGSVHLDSVLEYNRDPAHMADLLLHRLTVEARRHMETTGLSKREIVRRLGTSPSQLYRLLDPANRRKSLRQMVALLSILGCGVEVEVTDPGPLVVREGRARRARSK